MENAVTIEITRVEVINGSHGQGLYLTAKVVNPSGKSKKSQQIYNELCCGKAELTQEHLTVQ